MDYLLHMLEHRLDFDHRIGLVGSGEPDPALDGPGLGDAGVVLQRLEEAVGGGGEVLHHHVALDTVVRLGGGGRGEARLLVAEDRIAKIVVREHNDERRRLGAGSSWFTQAVKLGDDVGGMGDGGDIAVSPGRVEAGLEEAVIDQLLEGIAAVRRLRLLVAVGRASTVNSRVVTLVSRTVTLAW